MVLVLVIKVIGGSDANQEENVLIWGFLVVLDKVQ